MKIYGLTIIDTDGIDRCSARYSETYLFTNEDERNETAWKLFSERFEEDEDEIDTSICDSKCPSKETFLLRLANAKYDYFVRYDSTFQVEVFETNLQ